MIFVTTNKIWKLTCTSNDEILLSTVCMLGKVYEFFKSICTRKNRSLKLLHVRKVWIPIQWRQFELSGLLLQTQTNIQTVLSSVFNIDASFHLAIVVHNFKALVSKLQKYGFLHSPVHVFCWWGWGHKVGHQGAEMGVLQGYQKVRVLSQTLKCLRQNSVFCFFNT